LDAATFLRIQRGMALDCCKWDMQVGDTSTLFPQPLLLRAETWEDLSRMAEGLAAELVLAERELAKRPELHAVLGLPKAFRHKMVQISDCGGATSALRVMRFDFHYTTDGWCISEVNSDVPGGYTEASCFTELMSAFFDGTRPVGDPAREVAEALSSSLTEDSYIALLSAPGFVEDQQVTAFLASALQNRGIRTFLLHHPEQFIWEDRKASTLLGNKKVAIDIIVRFYQGEWLARLPRSSGWEWFFRDTKTQVVNPGTALLTESKRFALTWDSLSTDMAQWRKLLPECREPDGKTLQETGEWVLKAAFSNTGDSVFASPWMPTRAWEEIRSVVKRNPAMWIAQRRFDAVPVWSAHGMVYPCIGVYTINGRAAGVYARASKRPVIDYAARDVAVLVEAESC
jgi:glutathionylspermidine synthase